MEMREGQPVVVLEVVDERQSQAGTAEHEPGEADRYDESPRAAHGPSPESTGAATPTLPPRRTSSPWLFQGDPPM